jgi:hypothetical protein
VLSGAAVLRYTCVNYGMVAFDFQKLFGAFGAPRGAVATARGAPRSGCAGMADVLREARRDLGKKTWLWERGVRWRGVLVRSDHVVLSFVAAGSAGAVAASVNPGLSFRRRSVLRTGEGCDTFLRGL